MNEWEKAQAGYLYNANYDKEILKKRKICADLCFDLNQTRPSDGQKRKEILRKIFTDTKNIPALLAPFQCDYGFNIHFGTGCFMNYNCVILDGAPVTFGDNVFVAPNCIFSTAGHPLDVEQRNEGLEIAMPIVIEDNVWIGGGVIVLPGVHIGKNTVIGAGSVVNRNIPDNVVAAGNPCRVIRKITEEDKNKYPVFQES